MDVRFVARYIVYVIGVVIALGTAARTPADAATLPAGFTESQVASGLASPTAMQFAPDGRLFVCEQGGRLRVIKDGVLLPTPFVTLTVNASGERGLLGVAFDPAFGSNRYVYVYYTATTPTVHNRISRFIANGDVAQSGSEVVILELDNLSGATNHNGGALAFGPDGKLYAAVGENANGANAQTLANLHGKMLRLNSDGTIPSDNPFYTTATGRNRAIWALGLRNPFTFAFNPNGPEMFINDVGQNTWEEINDGRAGANYGWPTTEGATGDPRFVSPRYAYHALGRRGCAITGGAFYSPLNARFPADYDGDYFFADFCGGWIRRLDPNAGNAVTNFASGIASPVDLKVTDDGRLYYLARGGGATTGVVYRIDYGAGAPAITTQPASRTVAVGAPVAFSVSASGAAPLGYQWRRNGANIAGATAQDYTIAAAALSDNGARFSVVVTNTLGSATSADAVLTVTANQAPTATIVQPAAGTLYAGGTVITYSGTGSDPESGSLPASAFTWQVDFHHDTHFHPFMQPTTGATGGSFTIPTTGHTEANVWYRIYLTVRDCRRPHPHDAARRAAANGPGHARDEPGAAPAPARRPAGDGADDVHRRRRHRPHPRCHDLAGGWRHDLRVRVVVGRRRRVAHRLDAGRQHDLHRDLSCRDGRDGHRSRGDLLQQRRFHRHDRGPHRSRPSTSTGHRARPRPPSASTRSARAGPARCSRSSPRPTRSTRRATTGSGCG